MRARQGLGLMLGCGLVLGLGACGDGKKVTAQNASSSEVAQKVKESGIANEAFISPGRWKMTMTVNDMKIPGLPPEMAERMKGQMGQPRTFEQCVTEEDAKKPKEEFFAGKEAPNCRYEHFEMGGGKISMVMHCANDQGKQTMKMNGTYSPEVYHMTVASQTEAKGAPSAAGSMTFNAVMDAKKVGACTGKEPG